MRLFADESITRRIEVDFRGRITSDSGRPHTGSKRVQGLTLVTVPWTKAKVQMPEFKKLRLPCTTRIHGDVIIQTMDGWRVFLGLRHIWERGVRCKRLGKEIQRSMSEALKRNVDTVGCNKPSKTDTRHPETRFAIDQGVDHLCWWNSTGDWNASNVVLSTNFIQNSGILGRLATIPTALFPLFEIANKITFAFDREWWQKAQDAYRVKIKGTLFDRLMNSGHFMWQGVALVHNLCTQAHVDVEDDGEGWATMFPLGDYKGGALELPQFGLVVDYRQHSMAMLRGPWIAHAVRAFEGYRHSVVLFWRHWFRTLPEDEVDWDSIKYGYEPEYGKTRSLRAGKNRVWRDDGDADDEKE